MLLSEAVAPERIWKWGHRSGQIFFWSGPSNFWL